MLSGTYRPDGLREGADLVDLQQQRVAPLAVDALLHALGVRDQQVITHHLHHRRQPLQGGGNNWETYIRLTILAYQVPYDFVCLEVVRTPVFDYRMLAIFDGTI